MYLPVVFGYLILSCATTSAFAYSALEEEWLFQGNHSITHDVLTNELTYTRDLAKRISGTAGATVLKNLDALPNFQAATTREQRESLYFQIRTIKRAVFFSHPLIDFDRILLIDNPYPKGPQGDATDEWGHEARHRNGFMSQNGGKLITTKICADKVLTSADAEVSNLLPNLKGSFFRPDLAYDGKKILFCYKPENEKSYHLYTCDADGSNLTQLTRGDYDDLDPVYMPDGKIVFCTSRQHSYVRCMPMTHSFAVARCDADGQNIYILSANGEPEYLPSVMNDGRVIFTRWEYTDKALWRVQSLWTMDPDGCNVQTFWGSQSVWPDLLGEVRAIPNSKKVMFVGIGHHAWWDGALGMIDPEKGLNYPDGLFRVTRETPWPEVGNGPADPPPHVDYHASGKIYAYKSPYPLSEELFLVSAREGKRLYNGEEGRSDTFRLYLMDVYGNKELIYKGAYNAYHAMPFKPRTKPAVLVDKVKWPKIGPANGTWQELLKTKPDAAIFYSNDVFENAPSILREKGKALRVIQMDPKTYTTWYKTVQHDGPAVSVFQADGVKRILGTVPIEDDGSVNFEVPPGQSLFFEMLDDQGMAIYVMRSFANGMPGEHRGCFGCHETSMKTRASQGSAIRKKGKALAKPAVKLTPPSWGAEESIGYTRFVQPVLDKHCASCHNKEGSKANAAIDFTYRPSVHGWKNWVYHRPNDKSPFYEPYYTLVDGQCRWGGSKPKDDRGVPRNLAGLFIVEGYSANDPKNLETLPPYSAFSPVSTLIRNAVSGNHHGVKVTGVDRERLIAWVDCNGPFLGTEEIHAMFDPWRPIFDAGLMPIYPRIGTAPVINRFNLRQDGDTRALCGALRQQPNRDEKFDPNKALAAVRLAEIQREKVAVKLISATYGGKAEGTPQIDVLEKLKTYAKETRFIDIGDKTYNAIFTDPCRLKVKQLRISYTLNDGPVKQMTLDENKPILLQK